MYELQFHPATVCQPVRYFFLSRRTVTWAVVGLALAGLTLATGLALAPLGVQALLLSGELHAATKHNELQHQILTQRAESLERVGRRVEMARTRQQQIALVLGAEQESPGLGGYPEHDPLPPSLPEAHAAVTKAGQLTTASKALLSLAEELAAFARDNHELTRVVPSICPVPIGQFVLTSPFGERISPFTDATDFHAGIDLAAREGAPVLAAGHGLVVFAGRFPLQRDVRWWRYGTVVVVSHGASYITIYAHLEKALVKTGQAVARGDQVGTVGNTGWSTSPHLHYEVRVAHGDGEAVPIDPRIYILDYQWQDHESILAADRLAPASSFDPLPSRVKLR